MNKGYNSVISLNDLLIKVNLGVTEEERKKLQDIKISFKLFFNSLPKACESDDLNDTVCYHKISNIAHEHCKSNSVHLLEHLCYEIYKKVRKEIDGGAKIWIKVEKCNPPIEGLVGSTSFEYSDF